MHSVLIVDDDTTFRKMAVSLLREAGFCVLEACDGTDAMRVLRESIELPRVVLLDVVKGKGSSDSFGEIVSSTYPGLVVLTTSSNRPAPHFATGSLPKPVSSLDLISTIREFCGDDPRACSSAAPAR